MIVLESGKYFGSRLRDRAIGAFQVTESRYQPYQSLPQHAHDQHVLIVSIAGSRIDETGRSEPIPCSTGSVQFHPAAVPHAHRFGPTDSVVLNVTLSDRACAPYAELIRERSMLSGGFRPLRANWLATRMMAESIVADQHSDLALSELVTEFFARTFDFPRAPARARPCWLDDVLDCVHSDDTGSITLGELAQCFQRHPAHLARTFRKWQGCSIGEYCRRRQLSQAVKDLAVTVRPISEVALRHGFSDQSHLTRVLRASLGLTPGQVRRRMRS